MAKKLSRRDFLKLSAAASGATALALCAPTAGTGMVAPVAAQAAKKLVFSSYTWSGYDTAINRTD